MEELSAVAAFEFANELFKFKVSGGTAGTVAQNTLGLAKIAVVLPSVVILKQDRGGAHQNGVDGTNISVLITAAAMEPE